ncbi:MAG: stage III sporulation protein AB [Clostridia bacterium]|nr:stage III sporulation protein AB [Clostridia bacterium]
MIRTLGLSLLLLGGILVSFEYAKYVDNRLRAEESILAFLSFLRREVGCYSRPLGTAVGHFSDEVLESCGFLPALRKNEIIADCANNALQILPVGEEFRAMFSSFGENFGTGYRDGELKILDGYLEEGERLLASDRRNLPRGVRLFRTLSLSVTLGLVIMLL